MRATLNSITIWILAALINALLVTLLVVFSDGSIESWPGVFALAFVFSLLFSAPGILIFWIVFVMSTDDENLFKLLLRTGIICAVLSGVFFVWLIGSELKGQAYYIASSSVIAAIAAIMIHHHFITSLNMNKQVKNENNKN